MRRLGAEEVSALDVDVLGLMAPPFTFHARGVVRGVAFVSDGSVLLRADLLAAAPHPDGVVEMPEDQLAKALTVVAGARPTTLEELVPAATAGALRTPSGVGLAERHVELLRALGRAITLWTRGPTAPIPIGEGPLLLGVVLPLALGPEDQAAGPPSMPSRAALNSADAFDGAALLTAFAGAVRGYGTTVEQVAALRRSATAGAPEHDVCVLKRDVTGGTIPTYFLVTIGLSRRPLGSSGPAFLSLFELATWTSHYDEALVRLLSDLGVMLHCLSDEGSRFALGHSISTDEGGWLGWPRVLLSRFVAPLPNGLGNVDVARVTPITHAEWAEKQSLGDVLGGNTYVTALESRGFPALLARWSTPPR